MNVRSDTTHTTLPKEPIAQRLKRGERLRFRDVIRETGHSFGKYKTGRLNAITDVPGVLVGQSTIIQGDGALKVGSGPVRTGVTAVVPREDVFNQRVAAGGFILNGAGEISGLTQVVEWGLLETPILLTNTLAVGTCSEALVRHMVQRYPGIGSELDVVIPVVGECDDSWLNDIAGRHVREQHVFEAMEKASHGSVAEGNVGGGTGMITCDFKGGLGTASRKLSQAQGGYTMGVIVMSNFGVMQDLRMDGLPIGKMLLPKFENAERRLNNYGSIIAVLATNAPLVSHQLSRLAKRVALGIGRVGSYAGHGSGEIIMAFSTANAIPRDTRKMVYRMKILLDRCLDPLYDAAIECTEEAILNALCMAESMTGVAGHRALALPLSDVHEAFLNFNAARP